MAKLAATLASLDDLEAAIHVGRGAVEQAETARQTAPRDANLAVATAVAICVVSSVSEMSGETQPSPSPLVAAGELIRDVEVKELDGVSCIDAAQSLLRLRVDDVGDRARYVADGLFAVDLVVRHCVQEPSEGGFEALGTVAQVAMSRCAAAGDAAGARWIQDAVVEVENALPAERAPRYRQFFADFRLRLASMASTVRRPG